VVGLLRSRPKDATAGILVDHRVTRAASRPPLKALRNLGVGVERAHHPGVVID
jgi:hypothetical protein